MALYKGSIKVSGSGANPGALPTVQPSNPSAGEMYYDTTAGMIKVYNGTSWEEVGNDVAWGSITGTLSDQTDLNTALNAKANDADVVKLTGAQTIAGTKTFQDEPIVPSKTRAAIYHGQKIATEAQVYAKQDKLTIGDGLKMEGTTLSVIKEPVEYSGGAGIAITKGGDYSAMRGPAPVGFHVPSIEDRQGLKSIMDGLTFSRQSGAAWMDVLKLAPAGLIDFDTYTPEYQGYTLFYWSSTPVIGTASAKSIQLDAASINIPSTSFRSYGLSIRCFKDSFVVPTSSWTVLNGTLGSAGVFWDSANGLISVTGNGTTGYTIMDKNLGASTVYSYGAACTESNCGKYYQWGNNFGFDYAGPEYTTQVVVNASSYGPGNYYSFDEFFFGDVDWTDPSNDNLRGGVTGVKDSISNSGVTSVNGQTGNVTIPEPNVLAVTQAEYDALPAATKNDGKLRIISDTPAIDISGGFEPENSGMTGQVLKKTATGYDWGNIDSISTTQPSSPSAGSTYFDTTSLAVKVYDGTQWNELGSGGGGGGLGLEYMNKVTLNGSGDGEHWLNTGVGSLAYDAYVVCLTNSTCRFILGVELGDYNYPRAATNDIKNGIMQVSGDSKWLRAGEKLFIYDYYGSGAVYNFYIYKFTRPS